MRKTVVGETPTLAAGSNNIRVNWKVFFRKSNKKEEIWLGQRNLFVQSPWCESLLFYPSKLQKYERTLINIIAESFYPNFCKKTYFPVNLGAVAKLLSSQGEAPKYQLLITEWEVNAF